MTFFANSVQNSHATHRGGPTDSVNVQGEIICEMIMVNFSGFLTSLNWHSCLIKNQNHYDDDFVDVDDSGNDWLEQ